MNNVFSIKRIAALLNYEYSNSKKTHLTVFCALFACFLLFSFYNQIYDYNDAKVFAEEQKNYEQPMAVEKLPLQNFYTAEEYHQDYLDKNPDGYCHLPLELFEFARRAKEK